MDCATFVTDIMFVTTVKVLATVRFVILFSTFLSSPPDSRIFTSAQWTTISSNSSNLKTTYPGVQSVTINTPASGGVSTYYITRVGYTN